MRLSTERLMATLREAMLWFKSATNGFSLLLSLMRRSLLRTIWLYSLICASMVVLSIPEFAGNSAPSCAGLSRYSLMNFAMASWLLTSKDLVLNCEEASIYDAEIDWISVIL